VGKDVNIGLVILFMTIYMIVNILYYLGGIKMADIMAGMWDFVVRKQLTNHLGPSVKGTILDLDDRLLLRPFFRGLYKDTDIREFLPTQQFFSKEYSWASLYENLTV
jgi:hypothetical protein